MHRLRAECDAIVVGIGTVLADDPSSPCATCDGRSPAAARGCRAAAPGAPGGAHVLDDAADTLRAVPTTIHAAVLAALAERDVVSVLLEGGPTLAASFVAAGLVDKVVGYVAPALLGAGRRCSGPVGIDTIADDLEIAGRRRAADRRRRPHRRLPDATMHPTRAPDRAGE